jgi:hypothetical protein
MNVQLLLDAVVRQTTVLIAELATAGGARAPLAHVANQVFLDLAAELERQGIGKKVSADMFGLALRSYQRKIARLRESSTERGRSLWSAVYDFLVDRGVVTRAEVFRHFDRDDEELVGGVLYDLTESGIVFSSGRGPSAAYRVVTRDELERLSPADDAGVDAVVWTMIYRDGPVTRDDLARSSTLRADVLDSVLARLVDAGRISAHTDAKQTTYTSPELVIPVDAAIGWEAAVLDHFQAMVRTVVNRLRLSPGDTDKQRVVGGSTYTLVVWPEHPCYEEARGTLATFRAQQSALRARVDAHNAAHGIPESHQKIVSYFGQYSITQDGADASSQTPRQ